MSLGVPLEGGAPISVCDSCSVAYGTARSSAPPLSWSLDGKWVYVLLRHFPFGSLETAVISIKTGAAPLGIAPEAQAINAFEDSADLVGQETSCSL
jgi:hypothetical protein